MIYLYCVVIPLLIQVGAVYIVILMNTGNGSWMGLLVFLLAMPIVPITAIINAARTRANKEKKTTQQLFIQAIIVACIAPLVISGLFIVSVLIEGLLR